MVAHIQVLVGVPRAAVREADGTPPAFVADEQRTAVRKGRPVGNQQRIAVRTADVAETRFAVHLESGALPAHDDAVVERHPPVPDIGIRLSAGLNDRDRGRGAACHLEQVRGGGVSDIGNAGGGERRPVCHEKPVLVARVIAYRVTILVPLAQIDVAGDRSRGVVVEDGL